MSGRDGGDAFPGNGTRGMSLRDYFAAKALHALIRKSPDRVIEIDDVLFGRTARGAYAYADAMLKAREVTP